jgi:hypothetical protein
MKKVPLLLLFILWPLTTYSQNELKGLLDELSDLTGIEIDFTRSTFKSTRIMNGHSVERMAPGELDFRISHRFGRINSGAYEFFGLDQANIHLSLEYGVAKWLMLGVGRGTYEKTFDGFAKFTLARQSSGDKSFPLSVSLLSSMAYRTVKAGGAAEDYTFSERASFTGQLLAARRINQNLSIQLMPTVIKRNVPGTKPDILWAAGAGGRVKLARRVSLNAEYYYCFDAGTYLNSDIYNPLSIGFDIETGGHVFQLIFTNSVAMIEKGFIGETTGSWGKGDIHFGFNISRVFDLGRN